MIYCLWSLEFILPGEDKLAFGVDITLAVKHELSVEDVGAGKDQFIRSLFPCDRSVHQKYIVILE